jgi:EmrB/QacA subfamily drug resistance transporter
MEEGVEGHRLPSSLQRAERIRPRYAATVDDALLSVRSTRGRWVLATTVLGSGVAFLDATVVNVALPRIGRDLHVGLADLQWTSIAYTLTLSAFLLLGGALGDRYGRRRVFVVGLGWFAIASLACGLAPSAPVLVFARAVQGVGGALATPGSLAIIEASFRPEDRGQAIGTWSGLGALFGAAGPLLGGFLVQLVSWRLVFFINLPLALAAILVALRHVPESGGMRLGHLDVAGPLLAALGLGGLTYGLIEGNAVGWGDAVVLGTLLGGAAVLAAFFVVEKFERDPILPLSIFRSREFSGANGSTFAIYGALGAVSFLVVLQLQEVLRYTPLAAGASLLPLTLILLLFSARSGRLASVIGPRLPMTLGALIAATGMALFVRVDVGSSYVTTILPATIVFGLGMVLIVPALTTTAMGAVSPEHAGIASAVNNDVARAAGLVAVAVVPALAGISAAGSAVHGASLAAGFPRGMLICAALCAVGGAVAFLTIPGTRRLHPGTIHTTQTAMPPPLCPQPQTEGFRRPAPAPGPP